MELDLIGWADYLVNPEGQFNFESRLANGRTIFFVCFLLITVNKSNSSVRFLGESTARQSAFRFYLTFKRSQGYFSLSYILIYFFKYEINFSLSAPEIHA